MSARDPWQDQRARNGLNTLVRVIDLETDRQEFILLRPPLKNRGDVRDLAFNGETVILPDTQRTEAEVAEIVARFDERYWADDTNKQTRYSALDDEKYLGPR